jgi:hypothetical protein
MQTKTMIQAQANVIKITSLKKGDVVKMIEKEYSSHDVYYGVVLDLLNSGNECFIQILRYKRSYSQIDGQIKTYSGKEEMALFPATVEEVKDHFKEAVEYAKRSVKKKQEELMQEEKALATALEFTTGELAKSLHDASFTEMTQVEFNQKKEALKELE